MTVNNQPLQDDKQGTQDASSASWVPGKFFSPFLSIFWLIFIIWLQHEDKLTPPVPSQQMGIFYFFWLNRSNSLRGGVRAQDMFQALGTFYFIFQLYLLY